MPSHDALPGLSTPHRRWTGTGARRLLEGDVGADPDGRGGDGEERAAGEHPGDEHGAPVVGGDVPSRPPLPALVPQGADEERARRQDRQKPARARLRSERVRN